MEKINPEQYDRIIELTNQTISNLEKVAGQLENLQYKLLDLAMKLDKSGAHQAAEIADEAIDKARKNL